MDDNVVVRSSYTGRDGEGGGRYCGSLRDLGPGDQVPEIQQMPLKASEKASGV